MTPSRQLYWNIILPRLVEVLFIPFLVIFLIGLWRHWQGWRHGKSFLPANHLWARLGALVTHGLLQMKLSRDVYAGIMHLSLFWGLVVLFVATVLVAMQDYFRIPVLSGPFYLYFMSLTVDLFGLLAIVGCLLALVRRYGIRIDRLHAVTSEAKYGLMVGLLLVVLVTGFLLEGLRIAATRDPWGPWSVGGWLLSRWFAGWPPESLVDIHRWLWWGHALLAFTWIAFLPFTGLLHGLTAPLTIAFRHLDSIGSIPMLDLQKAQSFGAGSIEQFSTKHLIELDTCTECGRCEVACPAWITRKPLTPRRIVLSLRSALRTVGRKVRNPILIGAAISEDALWACTTCGACTEACPVFIDPMEKILEMRRYASMELMRVPRTMQEALFSLEDRGHPFRGTTASRTDWTDGLDAPLASDAGQIDVLYWVGCASALEPRGRSIAQAMVRIMEAAEISFGILGEEEQCCGHPARRMGHEYLFQMLAAHNIEMLQRYSVRTIITSCAHCYHSLTHEYSQLGASFTVQHHTQFIADLLREGRLYMSRPVSHSVVFHDPCYLGRMNGQFSAPRAILHALPGLRIKELARNRMQSMCCGAGGGRYWAEEEGERISHVRMREAESSGATVVATACPFCAMMFEEAKDTPGLHIRPLDVAELVAQALPA